MIVALLVMVDVPELAGWHSHRGFLAMLGLGASSHVLDVANGSGGPERPMQTSAVACL
jgi:hypothetical protein